MNQKPQYILQFFVLAWLVSQTNTVTAASVSEISLFKPIYWLLLLLFVVSVFLTFRVRKNAKVLDTLRNELKYLSRTDDLTQLFNRRYLEKRVYQVFERHIRNKSSNSVLMMVGLDDFQSLVNERGRSAGDLVIQTTANLILGRVRNTDLCGRFSEDTFLVLLRDTTEKPAKKLAEEVRLKLQDTEILYGQQKISAACSIGLASYSENMDSCRDWIQQTDQALNRDKQLGGNQTTVY